MHRFPPTASGSGRSRRRRACADEVVATSAEDRDRVRGRSPRTIGLRRRRRAPRERPDRGGLQSPGMSRTASHARTDASGATRERWSRRCGRGDQVEQAEAQRVGFAQQARARRCRSVTGTPRPARRPARRGRSTFASHEGAELPRAKHYIQEGPTPPRCRREHGGRAGHAGVTDQRAGDRPLGQARSRVRNASSVGSAGTACTPQVPLAR